MPSAHCLLQVQKGQGLLERLAERLAADADQEVLALADSGCTGCKRCSASVYRCPCARDCIEVS